MDADVYLKEVLAAQTLKDDSDEMKALRKRRAEVESLLRAEFKDSNPRIRYSGSHSKGTMILESYDLDLTCYFAQDDNAAGESLKDIYANVKKALEKKYKVTAKNTSLRLLGLDQDVHGQDFHIDVVPGRFTDKDEKDVFLHQAEAEKERLKTNLDIHVSHVKDSGYTDAIRLMKLWRERHDVEIKTFVLELLVIKLLDDRSLTKLSSQLLHVWEEFRDKSASLCVEDPANPQGNDLSKMLPEGLRGTMQQVAKDTLETIENKGWEAVFGKLTEGKEAGRAEALVGAVASRQSSGAMKPWAA